MSPEPTGTLWQWRVHTDDVDTHAASQPGWRLRYEQLSPGRFAGLVHHVQLPGARLVHERCNVAVRQRGPFGEGSYGFAMGLPHPELAVFNGQKVERDGVMLGRAGELDLCTPAGFELVAVVVDSQLLTPLWEHMYGKKPSAWMEAQLVVPARPAVADALRSLHQRLMSEAAALLSCPCGAGSPATGDDPPTRDDTASRQLRDALLIEWLEALPASVDASALPNALARKRTVDRACELMLSHADEPLSMLDVCRQVGSSRRKLNYCFQDVLATSPVKYLRAVRLNGVRRALRVGGTTVQDAAARWGFLHLGQFARDYKAQFGERPSDTLRSR